MTVNAHPVGFSQTPAVAGWPKISVVTPSFNQAQFLERALQSVLSQTYPHLEYLVFDAGSTDGSPAILQRFEAGLSYWRSGPDRGQSDAIDRGWRQSGGEILAWLNSDDFYYPQALGHVATLFRSHPELKVLWGAIAIVDEREQWLRLKPARRLTAADLLLWKAVPGQAAAFIRREVFSTLGGPRLDLHYVMDWEFWLRILLHYPPSSIGLTQQVLAGARDWSGAKTRNAAGRDALEVRRVLQELFAGGELPQELRKLRRSALARTWWRQSKDELAAGRRRHALASLAKAVALSPPAFPPLKILRQFSRIFRNAPGMG